MRAFRDYLVFLRRAVAIAQASGKSGDALVEAVMPKLTQNYGSWGWFKYFARRNTEQTAEELNGTKQIPVPGVR